MKFSVIVGLIGIGLSCVLAGCSGSADSVTARGAADVAIKWPSTSQASADRLLPGLTQSVVVALDNGRGFTTAQIVNRDPDAELAAARFENIPEGDVAVTVTAYPDFNGQGTPLGIGAATAFILPKRTSVLAVNLNSTIAALALSQYPSELENATSLQLLATALNAQNEIVPVRLGGFGWVSSDTEIAEVDQHGVISAKKQGYVDITAIERESGISTALRLKITPGHGSLIILIEDTPITLALNATSVQVPLSGTYQFSATLTGTPNQWVIWSTDGGTITSTGLFTAPAQTGTVHITATSVANPSISATATVKVGGEGGFDFIIH